MSCKCCCTHGHTAIQEKRNSLLKDYWRIILSALLLFGGLILNATDTTFFKGEYVPFIWYLLAYLPVGLPVMREAWESILQKDVFSEFTLMSIATLGAFYIGEYPEGVAVMLFYSLGELFQDKAVDKAKRNISALLDVRPETATVIRNGSTLVEAPQRVQVGETIEVKAGERVPLDGTMLDEVAAFNTSALTGESVPRNIRQGGEVLAGMIATDKVVRIQVTKPFEKSALSRILELVQNASERKAPAELFIRKFARIYTPAVTGLAALIVLLPFLYSLADAQFSFIFNDWLYRALVFLVISCPCALVVSIPLGYFGGIGAASRLGVLFKGGNYLDAITQVNTVVFDKTGTLTKGTFDVQSCQAQPGVTEEKLIQLAASAERNSTHPIAKAIISYAQQRDIELIATTDVTEIAGHGLQATMDGTRVLVGNTRLLTKFGIEYPAITQVNTVVFDKTGTLTKGTFDVQSCQAQPGVTEEKLIQLAASAERNSTHPIAKAIISYAQQRDIELIATTDVTEIAGHGLQATMDGTRVLVGNTRLLTKFGIEYPDELSSIVDTIVACAIGTKYAGYLLLSDTLKEDAVNAVKELKALNINNIQILSGDKQAIVTNFAEKLGITQAYGDLLPDGKVKHIEALRSNPANRIAFVGDGINDAPVLALSHVGIAMGGLGSDAAIETADVVIQTDQPSRVATAIHAGRQTRRIVWQNISLAFGVKLLVLILGAGGIATLWEAVFADVGVALIAIVNAIRIQKLIK